MVVKKVVLDTSGIAKWYLTEELMSKTTQLGRVKHIKQL